MENNSIGDKNIDDISTVSQGLVIKTELVCEELEPEMELGSYIDGAERANSELRFKDESSEQEIESVSSDCPQLQITNEENEENLQLPIEDELIKQEMDSLPGISEEGSENMSLNTRNESARELEMMPNFTEIKTENMESAGSGANEQNIHSGSVVFPAYYESFMDAPSSSIIYLGDIHSNRYLPSNQLQDGESSDFPADNQNEFKVGKRKGFPAKRVKKTMDVKESLQRTCKRKLRPKLAQTKPSSNARDVLYNERKKKCTKSKGKSREKCKTSNKNKASKISNQTVKIGRKNKRTTGKYQGHDRGKSRTKCSEKGDTSCDADLISCPYCSIEVDMGKNCKRYSKLRAHITSSHLTKIKQCGEHTKHPWLRYQCSQCDRMLLSIQRLLDHLILAHPVDHQSQQSQDDSTKCNLFQCPNESCEHSFIEEMALKDHLPYCHFTPSRKMGKRGMSMMKRKEKNPNQHGPKRTIVRRTCKSVISSENHKHSIAAKCSPECLKQAWSRIPFKCSSCEREFRNHSDMVYHEALRHSERGLRLKCEFCQEQEFRTYHQLKQHMDNGIHDDTDVSNISEDSKIECSTCGQIFLSTWWLKRHVKAHHKAQSGGMCQLCGKEFSTPNYVDKHVRTVHMNEPSFKRYKCETCNKMFRFKYALNVHMIDDHPEVKTQVDKTCDKEKNEESNQALPTSSSGVQLEFKCELCGKSYPEKKSLKLHCAKVHPANSELLSDYKCEICGKVSTSRSAVLNHKKLHQQERSFTCSYCFKTFNSMSNLNNHLVTHSRIKDYNCPMCTKSFGTQSSLYNHLYRYKAHGDVPKIKGYGSKCKSKPNERKIFSVSDDSDQDNI